MRAKHIEKLLSSLGCEKIRSTENKVRSTCPLAPWRHGGGRDDNPSLAVFISSDDSSGANCMSGKCNFHGSLTDLIYRLQRLSGKDLSSQLIFVSENNLVNLEKQMSRIDSMAGYYAMPPKEKNLIPAHEGKDYSDPVIRASMSPALPDSASEMAAKMHSWLDDESMDYLTGPDRRLTKDTIEKWKIGWHPEARRVSLPQYDRDGRLVNLSGRYLKREYDLAGKGKPPKWMHSKGFNREMFLFGENLFELNEESLGTVILVEGGFDVVFLSQCGVKNVAGINGSHINKNQIDKILKWFNSVIILMDGDAAGIEASKRIEQSLAKRVHVVVYHIKDGRDPNQMTDEEIQDLKTRFQP
jgi:5S rRNA maturation endonuclease (ribonuclease M5)